MNLRTFHCILIGLAILSATSLFAEPGLPYEPNCAYGEAPRNNEPFAWLVVEDVAAMDWSQAEACDQAKSDANLASILALAEFESSCEMDGGTLKHNFFVTGGIEEPSNCSCSYSPPYWECTIERYYFYAAKCCVPHA